MEITLNVSQAGAIKNAVGEGRVLADANSGIVRGWCENPHDGRVMRAIRHWFPAAEEFSESLVRLGGFRRFAGEGSLVSTLANARLSTDSEFVKSLHLFEDLDSEGMRTIIAAGLLS